MDRFNTDKSTGKDIQTSIFLKSLRSEMDKMASSLRKDDMVKKASEYLSDGCSKEEAQELLAIDGFDKDLVRSYLKKAFLSNNNLDDVLWGFDLEDVYGKIMTHEDLGVEVYAKNEVEAMAKAEGMIRLAGSEDDSGRIIGVYPL